jgi:molybdate transport system substrate-binding protein
LLPFLALWALLPPWGSASPAPIVVSAAISLTDALEEAGRAWTAAGGGEVRFNFAGSNALARQIVAGAPVDVFISADVAQMQVVQAAGAIMPETKVDLWGNRLAVVTGPGAPAIRTAGDLTQPSVKRIAIGDPQAVPAGVYAKQFLERAGVWEALAGRIVPVAHVRAALSAVETGSVDAAIVYQSDVRDGDTAQIAFLVTGPMAPRIVYPGAVVSRSKNPALAARFLAFLGTPEAKAIFKRFRFEPLGGR